MVVIFVQTPCHPRRRSVSKDPTNGVEVLFNPGHSLATLRNPELLLQGRGTSKDGAGFRPHRCILQI